MSHFTTNPALDLVLERTIALPPDRVWAAWTQPELLMQWFTPAPWKTVGCDMDLRPGGRSDTTMESPDGERFPNNGCILQVIQPCVPNPREDACGVCELLLRELLRVAGDDEISDRANQEQRKAKQPRVHER